MKWKTQFVRALETEIDQGRVYVADQNKRHWIPSPEVAQSYGWDLSQTKDVSLKEVCKLERSYDIAYNFDDGLIPSVYDKGVVFYRVWGRQWFGAQFHGHGLELSAASAPWPCKLGVTVDYSDPFNQNDGCKTGYANKDYVPLTYHASLEDMSEIKKTDYNFICCSHVIEHTPNVLLALKNVYEHLLPGGMFVMAVPHMNHTFDHLRILTTLSHIVTDYEDYKYERNLLHVVDHFENVNIKHFGGAEDITKICQDYILGKAKIDIHYHTFTEENMAQIIVWFNENIYRWKSTEIFNRLEGANEFFVRLIK